MVIIFNDEVDHIRRVGGYRIASALRAYGAEVEVIDFLAQWDNDLLESTLNIIHDIEWVGISLPFQHFYKGERTQGVAIDIDRLLNYFKNRNIPVVLGGARADIIKYNVYDSIIVKGDGDEAVCAIHDHITKNSELIFEIEENNNKVVNGDLNYKNISLDNIATEFVHSDFIMPYEILPLEISRGCIFKCKFCAYPHIGKKPGTYIRGKECIKKDIKRNYEEYKIKKFWFLDETFNDSVEKMEMIREIREETGIDFSFRAYGRLDLLAAKPEMVNLIGSIGWNYIVAGIETFNRPTGSVIGKGGDPEKLKTVMIDIRDRYPDVTIQCNLIAGLPHSNKDEIYETVDWLLKNQFTFIKINPLRIQNKARHRVSEFSKDPKKYGFEIIDVGGFKPYDWTSDGWTFKEAEAFTKEIKKYILDNKGFDGKGEESKKVRYLGLVDYNVYKSSKISFFKEKYSK